MQQKLCPGPGWAGGTDRQCPSPPSPARESSPVVFDALSSNRWAQAPQSPLAGACPPRLLFRIFMLSAHFTAHGSRKHKKLLAQAPQPPLARACPPRLRCMPLRLFMLPAHITAHGGGKHKKQSVGSGSSNCTDPGAPPRLRFMLFIFLCFRLISPPMGAEIIKSLQIIKNNRWAQAPQAGSALDDLKGV